MTKVDKDVRIASIRSEIVNRVKAIELQKAEKKSIQSRYNETIKSLESEKAHFLAELEAAQREELTEAADEILEANNSHDLVE